MARLSLLVLIAALFSLATASPCYTHCRFRFCYHKTVFRVGRIIERPFTGAICKKDGTRIGVVGETGEAWVLGLHKFVPISKWRPSGLKQRFSPSFFKSYARLRRSKYGYFSSVSGVGHEKPQQNQLKFLNNKCFVLPIKAYQIIEGAKKVIVNRHRDHPFRDCVSFRTRVY